MNILIILIIVGAVVYLFVGGREGLVDRIGELGKWCFFAALLALLLK